MSTVLAEMEDGTTILRFSGGTERGVCYQINAPDGSYVVYDMMGFIRLTLTMYRIVIASVADGFVRGMLTATQDPEATDNERG